MLLRFDDREKPIAEWARELGITERDLRWRLKRWPIERALTAEQYEREYPTFTKSRGGYGLWEARVIAGDRQEFIGFGHGEKRAILNATRQVVMHEDKRNGQ